MIHVYRLLIHSTVLFMKIFRPFLNAKLRYFLDENGSFFKVPEDSRRRKQKPLWIHASSGEIEYALPLIEKVGELHSQVPLLVTHSSLSSRKNLEALKADWKGVIPLDRRSEINQFLQTVEPRALLISRTDVWPELISELNKRNIPVYLFSATFAPGSHKLGFLSRLFLKNTFRQITEIFVVSEEDAQVAKQFFSSSQVRVLGDTRYDRVQDRLQRASQLPIPPHDKILVLGSLWPEDENQFFPILKNLIEENWKLVWTPHEIDESKIKHLQSRLQTLGIRFHLASHELTSRLWQETDVLIVDKMGWLASLYKWAQISFVGGSFRRQVHSVMEPLGALCPVIVGPFHTNNREAIEFSHLGAVFVAHNSGELLQGIRSLSKDRQKIQSLLKQELQNRRGSTQKLIEILKDRGLFQETELSAHQTN